MNKKELRKIIRAEMAELTPEYCAAASRSIAEQVCASDEFKKAKTVFAFINMAKEPFMAPIIEEAWSLGKRVCIPRCYLKPEMIAQEIKSWNDLVPGAFGIPEAFEDCEMVPASEIDLVLVPCMSASKSGKRLGHGAGYYDCFLKGQNAYKMCVCFKALLHEEIPMEDNDIVMDTVIYDRL